MEKPVEFMFSGCPVKVELQKKMVVVHFFGRPLNFMATQAALRERVRAELTKAGLLPQLQRILNSERTAKKK